MAKTTNLVDYVKDKWDEQKKFARSRWQDYYNNIAFYEGYQWQSWEFNINGFTPAPQEDMATGKIYATSNLIKPLVDTRISKILGNRPILDVTSEKKTAEKIEQAVNNTKILKALWQDLNMQSLLTHVEKWAVITNHCFVRPYFDPEHGIEVVNPLYDEGTMRQYTDAGYEYTESPTIRVGRNSMDVFTPLQVLFDTTPPTWRDVRRRGWTLMKYIKSIDSLISHYGEDKIKTIIPEPKASVSTVDEQLLNLFGTGTKQSRERDRTFKEDKPRNVSVYEYYEAPSNRFPNGLHCAVCQDVMLYDSREEDEKLPKGLIPVVMFVDQPGMNTLWGRSLVSGSRQKQKQYNVLKSKMIEHCRLPAIYAFDVNSGVDTDNLPGKSYIVCKYDPESGPPLIVSPPPFPETGHIEMQDIKMELGDYWALHEVSVRARPPSKGMSGRGIFLLQEADVSRLATTLSMFSESLSDVGEILLALAKENYTEKRSMNYPGKTGTAEAVEFIGSTDILEEYSVSVTVGSDFQRNRESLQQFVIQLLGVISNVPAVAQVLNDPMVFHKLLSFISEEFANILMTKNQDAGKAEKENRLLLEGGNPPVQPWHNHAVHVKVLMSLLNSDEFTALPDARQKEIVGWTEGEGKDAIPHGHLVSHLHYIQQNIQQQTSMQQGIPPGGQPQGGGPVFKQGGEQMGGPEMVDRVIEKKVQPNSGVYGTEEIP